MKNHLQKSSRGLPFFDKRTLKKVRPYILNLEAKSSKNAVETKELADYLKIIKERDERVACVEKALSGGHGIAERLMSRKNEAQDLEWIVRSDEVSAEIQDSIREQEVRMIFAGTY